MMKKLSIALLAATVVAGAASANQTGFFVGLGGVTGAVTGKGTAVSANPANIATRSFDNGKTIFGGRLEVGYGMTFAGCGYASLSIYGTLANTKIKAFDELPTGFEKIELRNKHNYGAEIKLGYHLTKDTVGFIGVAAEAGKYELKYTQASAANPNESRPALKTSKTKVYAKPVIGVRTMFTRNLFVEAKYGFGIANKINLNAPVDEDGAATRTATGGARKVSVKPRTHEFSVTIGWKF